MKATTWIRIFVSMAGLTVLGASSTYAQSEIAPDHFDSPNTEPFRQSHSSASAQVAILRYEGNFALPHAVRCRGKNLPPGKYSFSLHSDGKIAEGTLKSNNQAFGVAGVVHKQARKATYDALVMEDKGEAWTLSVIQLVGLDFVIDGRHEKALNSKARRIKRLPLTLMSAKN